MRVSLEYGPVRFLLCALWVLISSKRLHVIPSELHIRNWNQDWLCHNQWRHVAPHDAALSKPHLLPLHVLAINFPHSSSTPCPSPPLAHCTQLLYLIKHYYYGNKVLFFKVRKLTRRAFDSGKSHHFSTCALVWYRIQVRYAGTDCTCPGGTYTNVGTIQRRLAWPPAQGWHANSWSVPYFFRPLSFLREWILWGGNVYECTERRPCCFETFVYPITWNSFVEPI